MRPTQGVNQKLPYCHAKQFSVCDLQIARMPHPTLPSLRAQLSEPRLRFFISAARVRRLLRVLRSALPGENAQRSSFSLTIFIVQISISLSSLRSLVLSAFLHQRNSSAARPFCRAGYHLVLLQEPTQMLVLKPAA